MKVCIIGGGFTGLACATTLASHNIEVTILEKAELLGGLASGFKEPAWNYSLEYFYHHWFKSDKYVKNFAKIWGQENQIIYKRPLTCSETEHSGYVQLDSPLSLLQYPELNLFNKLRMAAVLVYLKLTNNWKQLEKYTAQDWCTKYMGKDGYQQIWEPMLIGKYGKELASEINMAWLWARLNCRTSELGTFPGGFSEYIHGAEKWLQQKNVSIKKSVNNIKLIKKIQNKWELTYQHFDNEVTESFDAVVVASNPYAFSSICGNLFPEYTAKLLNRKSLGVQVVILSLDNSLGDYYWYSLQKSKEYPFLALIEHTNFISSENYNGEKIIYLANYLDINSAEWNATDEQLLNLALKTCQKVSPQVKFSLRRHWIYKEKYAQPIVGINASQNIPNIEVEQNSGVYCATMGHVYPWDRGTNYALEIGQKTALKIISKS